MKTQFKKYDGKDLDAIIIQQPKKCILLRKELLQTSCFCVTNAVHEKCLVHHPVFDLSSTYL